MADAVPITFSNWDGDYDVFIASLPSLQHREFFLDLIKTVNELQDIVNALNVRLADLEP